MAESIQHKLSRVRPPRVQITYDVEIGDAIEKKELPFVVGVLADLSGESPKEKVAERKFVEIDRDNFNEVMEKIKPSLSFPIPKLGGEEGETETVALEFENIDDFRPESLVTMERNPEDPDDKQLVERKGELAGIPKLKALLKARQRLSDLLTKLDGNDELDGLLSQVISDTDARTNIRKEIADAAEAAADGDGTEEES